MNRAPSPIFSLPLTLALAPALALAACAEPVEQRSDRGVDGETGDLEVATTDGEAALLADAIPAGDFADLELGAKIIGPRGPEVKVAMSNEAGAFADMTSYVACPAGMATCDPSEAPEGTVYTYVHTVFPGEDNDAATGSGSGADSSTVELAELFRMTGPAHGFTGNAGFSRAEANAAVGDKVMVTVTCQDGALAWTIDAGEGGDQWAQAEPITFFWQSTLPPAGPANRYEITANYTTATGEGPYPAASETATNACLASSGTGGS
ncbi:hypothetical protein ACFCW2_12830 [Qipengyuania sp. DSG2-2]|uniref:hypothetical protein n=1 Tax=Qipengyuania sp. DGS2-2 TaxID=3349631 RepID=UPI0036D31DC8